MRVLSTCTYCKSMRLNLRCADEIDAKDKDTWQQFFTASFCWNLNWVVELSKPSRPYLISAGIHSGIQYIFIMNPLMSEVLSKAGFIEANITFNETRSIHTCLMLLLSMTRQWSGLYKYQPYILIQVVESVHQISSQQIHLYKNLSSKSKNIGSLALKHRSGNCCKLYALCIKKVLETMSITTDIPTEEVHGLNYHCPLPTR